MVCLLNGGLIGNLKELFFATCSLGPGGGRWEECEHRKRVNRHPSNVPCIDPVFLMSTKGPFPTAIYTFGQKSCLLGFGMSGDGPHRNLATARVPLKGHMYLSFCRYPFRVASKGLVPSTHFKGSPAWC